MFVKVCGLTEFEQIDWAVELGYDAIGVVCYRPSRRYCGEERARKLADHARGRIKRVCVSLAWGDVAPVRDSFDYFQVYEAGTRPGAILAVTDRPPAEAKYEYLIYDASQGQGKTGEFPDWLGEYRDKLIIAGGLTSKNAADTIRKIKPFGVDVSTGVELRGKKDRQLMKDFIREAQNAG
jgi:phosphoribosylanthranilate isomerase